MYGWDVRDVARIAVDAVRTWAADQDEDAGLPAEGLGRVDLVCFVLFSDAALAAFTAAIEGTT